MRLSVGVKISSIAAVILALMATVATVSHRYIDNLRADLELIATLQLPAADAITRVNVRVLEQGVLLERLWLVAETDAQLDGERQRFDALADQVEDTFAEAQSFLELEETKASGSHALVAVALEELEEVQIQVNEFVDNGLALMAHREDGNQEAFNAALPILADAQDAIDRELAGLRRHLEKITEGAVDRAEREQEALLRLNTILFAVAVLAGLGFAAIVTGRLVGGIRSLVATSRAVGEGDLDVVAEKRSDDELGELADAFNTMVADLRVKQRIKDTFGTYMDPRVVGKLLSTTSLTDMKGERHEMTVMFTDLKGFTSISEQLEAHDLVEVINAFLSHMTDAISEHGGVVDKFMGDAVMAYWGPPFSSAEDHAQAACRAALAAVDRLDVFRKELADRFQGRFEMPEIELRIGLSSGPMVLGSIGSKASRSFTVMGDAVNLGARLEGANKVYGTRIMISERTQALAGDDIRSRELDLIRVKGKTVPTRIFELLGGREAPDLATGLAAYRAQNWGGAETFFKDVATTATDDPLAPVYLGRIALLRQSPPPPDWDGVWTFETK